MARRWMRESVAPPAVERINQGLNISPTES